MHEHERKCLFWVNRVINTGQMSAEVNILSTNKMKRDCQTQCVTKINMKWWNISIKLDFSPQLCLNRRSWRKLIMLRHDYAIHCRESIFLVTFWGQNIIKWQSQQLGEVVFKIEGRGSGQEDQFKIANSNAPFFEKRQRENSHLACSVCSTVKWLEPPICTIENLSINVLIFSLHWFPPQLSSLDRIQLRLLAPLL